jgi:hypothetical protein
MGPGLGRGARRQDDFETGLLNEDGIVSRADNWKPMTDEERRALLEKWNQENLARMTPFERYLFDNGLFDDVIRPEMTADDVILEPGDHCIDVGCEYCIGYWRHDVRVSYCTHDCHKTSVRPKFPITIATISGALTARVSSRRASWSHAAPVPITSCSKSPSEGLFVASKNSFPLIDRDSPKHYYWTCGLLTSHAPVCNTSRACPNAI